MILVKNRVDSKKPRKEGLTYVVDRLQDYNKENWELLASFVDVVKINGALPLLASESSLAKKIKFYHDLGILVSTGHISTEYAIAQNSFERYVKEATRLEFDVIEIRENTCEDLSADRKKKINETVLSLGLKPQWKVGKRDPRHRLTIEDMLSKVEELVSFGFPKNNSGGKPRVWGWNL